MAIFNSYVKLPEGIKKNTIEYGAFLWYIDLQWDIHINISMVSKTIRILMGLYNYLDISSKKTTSIYKYLDGLYHDSYYLYYPYSSSWYFQFLKVFNPT